MPSLRADLIKTFAVANVIYEDEEISELPFTHDTADLDIFKQEQRKLQEKLSLIDIFPDMKALGLKLEAKDFI